MSQKKKGVALNSFSLLFQVGSNAGIVGMTKEHLGLALALNVPVFVVVTKIDMCPANILQGQFSGVLLPYNISSLYQIHIRPCVHVLANGLCAVCLHFYKLTSVVLLSF